MSEIAYDAYTQNYFYVVYNNKCIYHLHLGPFPLYCVNNQHDFKMIGEMKLNVIKLDF